MKVKDAIKLLQDYEPNNTIAIGWYDMNWLEEQLESIGTNTALLREELESILDDFGDYICVEYDVGDLLLQFVDNAIKAREC